MTLFKATATASLTVLVVVALKPVLEAQNGGACLPSCPPLEMARQPASTCDLPPASEPMTVERTIWVPQVVTEYRTETVTRYRRENRERTNVVYRNLPKKETVEEQYTVMVPEVRTRTVVDTINWPVYGEIELRKTDMTPKIEARTSTRTVCRMVATLEERTVYDSGYGYAAPAVVRTGGYRGEAAAASKPPRLDGPAADSTFGADAPPPTPSPDSASAGSCGTCCEPTCRLTRVTCLRPVYEKETIEYPVTHFESKAREQTVSFLEYQPEKRSRQERYSVDVPETRLRTREITVMRPVAEQRRESYTELVPYQEQIQVPVRVVRNVATRVTEAVMPSCVCP